MTVTTDAVGSLGGVDPIDAPTGAHPGFFRRFCRNRLAVAGLVFVALAGLVALLAPVLSPYDPNHQDFLVHFRGPGHGHWLGTDQYGRDVVSRLIHGTRVSFIAAGEAVTVGLVGGVPLGLIAGFAGRVVDAVVGRLMDALMAVPGLFLALTIVAVLGTGLSRAMLAVGILFIPRFFRVSRAAAQEVQAETFIEASYGIGCTTRRVLWRHVLPNIMSPLVVQVSILLGAAVAAEASLSFLGLGVRPPTASWGSMLSSGAQYVNRAQYLVYPPGICIALTVLAFALIGDGIRQALGTRSVSVDRGSQW